MVDVSQGYSRRMTTNWANRRLAISEGRLESMRYMLAIGGVLGIVTFTLTAITFFYSAGA